MKRLILVLCSIAFTASSFADDIQQYQRDTDAIWRAGAGAEDGTFTAISTSLVGWGIGLSVGIAILASVLHQSTASHSHTCKS